MVMMNNKLATFIIALVAQNVVSGFMTSQPFDRATPQRRTGLFSIGEWRDLDYHYPGMTDDRRLGSEQEGLPKEVNVLPFPFVDVLLHGETKQLRLYEDRFIKLFDDTMENHCGVVAMGLVASNGIIQTIPLCEVEAFNRMDGFGIFVTIRAVGRAKLVEVTEQEQYMKAVCLEISDKIPPNLELPNLLAKDIDESIDNISMMEQKLAKATKDGSVDFGDDDEEMKRRINTAKLDDRFYQDLDEEDDDDEDNDEDGDMLEQDRAMRYKGARKVALDFDTAVYLGVMSPKDDSSYSAQELTATSWAAFCSGLLSEEDAIFRIQAMDSDNLFDRLKLANQMLHKKEDYVKSMLSKAGINFRREDFSDGSS